MGLCHSKSQRDVIVDEVSKKVLPRFAEIKKEIWKLQIYINPELSANMQRVIIFLESTFTENLSPKPGCVWTLIKYCDNEHGVFIFIAVNCPHGAMDCYTTHSDFSVVHAPRTLTVLGVKSVYIHAMRRVGCKSADLVALELARLPHGVDVTDLPIYEPVNMVGKLSPRKYQGYPVLGKASACIFTARSVVTILDDVHCPQTDEEDDQNLGVHYQEDGSYSETLFPFEVLGGINAATNRSFAAPFVPLTSLRCYAPVTTGLPDHVDVIDNKKNEKRLSVSSAFHQSEDADALNACLCFNAWEIHSFHGLLIRKGIYNDDWTMHQKLILGLA